MCPSRTPAKNTSIPGFIDSGDALMESGQQDSHTPSGSEYPDPESLVAAPLWGSAPSHTDRTIDDMHGRELRWRVVVAKEQQSLHFTENRVALGADIEDEDYVNQSIEPFGNDDSGDESMSGLSESSQGRSDTRSIRVYKEPERNGQKGTKRGPRKALEPSNEFKSLHAQATMAFIDKDYESAEKFTLQAIVQNSEMYAAYSLLSEIHTARGDHDGAITALFSGAHTRPRDTQAWLIVAQLLLARADVEETLALTDVVYCYSRIIQIDTANVDARHQRAVLNLRLGHKGRAAQDYERLLRTLPHNLGILRSLAEIYTKTKYAYRAINHYNTSIRFYEVEEPQQATSVSWSDVNVYVELFANQGQYDKAMSKLKSLSRWLLGRRGDPMWENFNEDDREWDVEDYPRRNLVHGFRSKSFDSESYGKGLPLELRVKLGVYRLKSSHYSIEEALSHFRMLQPQDTASNAQSHHDYPDLFRDAADALRDAGLYREALDYYRPLQDIPEFADSSYHANMALCFQAVGLSVEAEECYRLFLSQRSKTQADEAKTNGDSLDNRNYGTSAEHTFKPISDNAVLGTLVDGELSRKSMPLAMLIPPPSRQSLKRRKSDKLFLAKQHGENMRTLHRRSRELLPRARAGDAEALIQWMAAAHELVDDFGSHRGFYPHDRAPTGYGQYTSSATEPSTLMCIRGTHDSTDAYNTQIGKFGPDPGVVPGDHRGIHFSSWLDLILEYAVLLARSANSEKAYSVLKIANDANVFYSSLDSMFLLHVCWFACALISRDEETMCNEARWFMKEFRLVTDGYRLFSAVHRLSDGSNNWFNCGPSQKFVLRQLKAMDLLLVNQTQQGDPDRGGQPCDARDNGNCLHGAADMDRALLMLYGYILYLGKSYSLALNYFFRAYALDRSNPVINLALALAYIQHAVKRQSDDRHQLITQGLTFLSVYYDLRHTSRQMSEQQEAEFNVARTYHMLGLTHLAVPYYQRCLHSASGQQGNEAEHLDDSSTFAALALRNIWAENDDSGKAMNITHRYLVI
ncbi:MAG: hypothetical protein Q9218_006150 [Villophora microphyllina]